MEAWVLNLDADLELGASRRYEPTKAVREATRAMAARVAPLLLGPGDRIVDDDTLAGSAKGLVGRAWCPTPRALALLERAGATPAPHPSMDVLRKVNARSFAARIGPPLPHAAFVTDRATADAMFRARPSAWRVKRQHGMAGRGHRVMDPSHRSKADDAFLDAGLAEGGVQIEPNVAIVAEYAKHGLVADGDVTLGRLVRQVCDARGQWLESRADAEPTPDERAIDATLAAKATEVASALIREGYFGPFGIDAFTYREADGALRLHPLGEINARYSMGFGVGLPRRASRD